MPGFCAHAVTEEKRGSRQMDGPWIRVGSRLALLSDASGFHPIATIVDISRRAAIAYCIVKLSCAET